MTRTVRALDPAEVAEAADVLAAAFDGYAWTTWTVAADDHLDRLAGLFRITLAEVGLPSGDVHVAVGDTGIEAVAVWLRPDRTVPGQVWADLEWREEALAGDRWSASLAAEAACLPLRTADPAFTLATVGVHPDHRRTGAGHAVLRPALAEADRLGVPAVLETSAQENLLFYSALGFTVTGEVQVAPEGPTVWAMRRPPRAA